MKKKKVELYPIYFRQGEYAFYCLLNEQTAMAVDLYKFTTRIQYDSYNSRTWMHDIFKNRKGECTKLNKSEFKKAFRTAMKILQEKLK